MKCVSKPNKNGVHAFACCLRPFGENAQYEHEQNHSVVFWTFCFSVTQIFPFCNFVTIIDNKFTWCMRFVNKIKIEKFTDWFVCSYINKIKSMSVSERAEKKLELNSHSFWMWMLLRGAQSKVTLALMKKKTIWQMVVCH